MKPPIYGLMAEFDTPEELLAASQSALDAGFRNMDAYSPFPVEGLPEAVGVRKTYMPMIVLLGGALGALTGYGLQYWVNTMAYPMIIGGKPFHSAPSFVIVTFEMTILFAGIAAVVGMLALNGLPQPYHPVFNVPRFTGASRDRFFLCIEATDPKFDRESTYNFLTGLKPVTVEEVPN